MRCVTKRWLVPSKVTPKLAWADDGTGGRRGSFWIVNNLDTLWVTEGHDPPIGDFYDLWSLRFMANENAASTAAGAAAWRKSQPQSQGLSVASASNTLDLAPMQASSSSKPLPVPVKMDDLVKPKTSPTAAKPQVWQEFIDPNTKHKYYYNSKTKETTWTKPADFK
jgi:hypothetical protein